MRIQLKKNRGNVLFGTLVTTGIICLYMGSYLSLVRSENQTTRRSQTWNMAIPVAEAGIEEALTQLRSTFPEIKETDGWNNVNGVIMKTRELTANEKFVVGIFPPNAANALVAPVIVSEGFVRLPNSTNFISRTVRINTKVGSYSMPGMVVVTTATLSGGKSLVVDSFNSTNSAFSTNGRYDVNKRGDKALLATLSNTDILKMGNASVYGKVATGYLGQEPDVKGVVGNLQWHNGRNKGIQPGAFTQDMNMGVEFPMAPFTSAIRPPTSAPGVSVLGNGDYAVEDLSGIVLVTGKARLLVTKSLNVSSLIISNATSTASLDLYVAAKEAKLAGVLNVQGRASNFKYFGLPANPKLNWLGNQTLEAGGNGQFTAMVYAPGTDLTLKGGGTEVEDFSGACLVKSVTMNGHYSFHYDESCASEMLKGFVTISWDEIDTKWETVLAKKMTVDDLY